MGNVFRLAALCLAILAPAAAPAADAPTLVASKELRWVDLAEPKGAKQAVLWGDAKSSENAVLVRWPFNTKAADQVRSQDVHILVLAGTFTTDIAGSYNEFGPSGVIVIPRGVKHTLGCEAAGECRFLVHHPGAVEVTKAK
jgi:quercetin dioxygenase-like cupin family protein